ncbi:hypothetical protein D3C71_1552210 [compost metagenome]
MPDEDGRALKKFLSESGNRIPRVHGFAAIAFEPLKQIVSKQLDEQIQFICLKITGCDAINGESVFGFFNVVLHATALVVEPPTIDWFPVHYCYHRFVLPVAVEHHAALAVIG